MAVPLIPVNRRRPQTCIPRVARHGHSPVAAAAQRPLGHRYCVAGAQHWMYRTCTIHLTRPSSSVQQQVSNRSCPWFPDDGFVRCASKFSGRLGRKTAVGVVLWKGPWFDHGDAAQQTWFIVSPASSLLNELDTRLAHFAACPIGCSHLAQPKSCGNVHTTSTRFGSILLVHLSRHLILLQLQLRDTRGHPSGKKGRCPGCLSRLLGMRVQLPVVSENDTFRTVRKNPYRWTELMLDLGAGGSPGFGGTQVAC
ncbi:hypothetical protein VTK56DRAFT_1847 [Thermocarpiscus australiensis]